MGRILISLNFMYCMERFATQIYRTQLGSFKDNPLAQQLLAASENESSHVQILRNQIKKLNGHIYPLGFLLQFMGIILGGITRLSGRRNLFKADIFVEKRAVRDYSSFIKNIPFNDDTINLLKAIIADENEHIRNWKSAIMMSGKRGRHILRLK